MTGVTILNKWTEGTIRHVIGTVTMDSSYVTAGNGTLQNIKLLNQLGFVREIHSFQVTGSAGGADTEAYVYGLNPASTYAMRVLVYEEEGAAAGGPLLEAPTGALVPNPVATFYATGW